MLKVVDGCVIACGCDRFYGETGRVMRWACAHSQSAKPARPCPCECHTEETHIATIWGDLPVGKVRYPKTTSGARLGGAFSAAE